MSLKYGVQIMNFQAASIYGVNLGIRAKFDQTKAMLPNSLFLDYLIGIKLNIHKEKFTRDVICIGFDYGSPTYESEVEKNDNKRKKLDSEYKAGKISEAEYEQRCKHLSADRADIESKRLLYQGIKKEDLRIKYYKEGVNITYKGRNGGEKTVHYNMLYRTPGKAKKGTCMFICDRLYKKAHNFLYMGYELPKNNSPIVEIGAYASLITSSIIGRVQIKPEQMLIAKDLPTNINTNVIAVRTDKETKQCYTEFEYNYNLGGEAFDGQALIDESIFPKEFENGEHGDGYVLLRHHMTKCAAFNTNIVKFMRDQYGDAYETATVTDMWGREVRVRDVRFITTNNAIKWLKFGITFDYWCDWIKRNDYMWGVVKTTHPSKFGDVQRMSYQMTNSLNIDNMENVVEYSKRYIEKLKSNNEQYFLEYLECNKNFSNDYEVIVELVRRYPSFTRSEYYRDRKKSIISAYVLDFKSGRTMQNADNLTICGSPYAMLLHSIGKDARDDPTFKQDSDSIECWCSRFKDGEYLAEFRSPFNSRNNLGHMHNVYHEYFDKYFNFGKLCIMVNTVDTDWQARNNGADQDSDSCYTTNQKDIVEHAKYCYKNYQTVVNEISPEKNIYELSLESYARIDNNLTACQQAIGQSSNLAQIALTYTYNFDDDRYKNYVAILSVLAQVAIDNAKRKFDVDLSSEINRIRNDMDIDKNGYPKFWLVTKKDKRRCSSDEQRQIRQRENKQKIKRKINEELKCPMNYLYDLNLEYRRNSKTTLKMREYFVNHSTSNDNRNTNKKVEELIEKYSLEIYKFNINTNENYEESNSELLLLKDDFEELISEIRKINISRNYLGMMSWLINRGFQISGQTHNTNRMNSKLMKNKALLMRVLYDVNKETFMKCFKDAEK